MITPDLPLNSRPWLSNRQQRQVLDLRQVFFLFAPGEEVRCPRCSDVRGEYTVWVCVRIHPGGRGAKPTGFGQSATCKCGWHLDFRFIIPAPIEAQLRLCR